MLGSAGRNPAQEPSDVGDAALKDLDLIPTTDLPWGDFDIGSRSDGHPPQPVQTGSPAVREVTCFQIDWASADPIAQEGWVLKRHRGHVLKDIRDAPIGDAA